MAYNVTSEWDDIHRKIGNYEPLPVEKKQEEYVQENINQLEKICKEEISDDSMFSDDGEYFEQYKRKQLEQIDEKNQETKKEKVFGWVNEITATDYVQEVNNAGDDVLVCLNLYQNYIDSSIKINSIFEELSKAYPKVKFLKSVATKCTENMPDEALPRILLYKNGKMVTQIDKLKLSQVSKLTPYSMEHLFSLLNIEEFAKKQNKMTSKQFIHEKMGIQETEDNEIDSDEEEREDKQYVSNKLFVKYQ